MGSDAGTSARSEGRWRLKKSWMNVLAPILASAFAWNHDQVMLAGGRGLARHLGVKLISATGSSEAERELPHTRA
jgi:hypothetical protein